MEKVERETYCLLSKFFNDEALRSLRFEKKKNRHIEVTYAIYDNVLLFVGHNSGVVKSKKIMKSIVRRNKADGLLEIFLAETVGTTFLMYFGCMGLFGSLTEVASVTPLQGGFVFGFVVASLIVVSICLGFNFMK